MQTNAVRGRVRRLPIMMRRKKPKTFAEASIASLHVAPQHSMSGDHSEAALAKEARLIATLRAGPYAHSKKVDPFISSADPLNPWEVAKRREWFVQKSMNTLRKQEKRSQKLGRQRFNVSLTMVHPRGVVGLEELTPAHFESRRRFHERRIASLEGDPYMMGYIDVTLNQDQNGDLHWQLHEHAILSVEASSLGQAINRVKEAYSLTDAGLIKRPLMVKAAPYPRSYLEYASRTAFVRNMVRRIGFLGQDDKPDRAEQPIKRKHLRMWLSGIAGLKPYDRMIFGGVRREGSRLRDSRRGRQLIAK